ncbi:MAG: serine hydrolase [Pseudomonadota bacterium]
MHSTRIAARRTLRVPLVFVLMLVWLTGRAAVNPADESGLLARLLQSAPAFAPVLADATQYEIQILYTRVEGKAFVTHGYQVDPARYFYPASTVKLPIAVLALEKLAALGIKGLDRDAEFLIDAGTESQTAAMADQSTPTGRPSVGHYIHKLLVVSDNDAFNRLYEFLGQAAIESRMRLHGYHQARILHRLGIPLTLAENRTTNPLSFRVDGRTVYSQPLIQSVAQWMPAEPILRGQAYFNAAGEKVESPFDFTWKNFYPLAEQQALLREIIYPTGRFQLGEGDLEFLRSRLSMLPRESEWPLYPVDEYTDGHVKFLMLGGEGDMPPNIRIYNKIGQAYGYLIDNAYIVDEAAGIEFFLAAVINVNRNRTYNDDDYEYDTIGLPFMRDLGQLIYAYERSR